MKNTDEPSVANAHEKGQMQGVAAVAPCSASFVLDCKGREILPGDTLKVFHFIGARRKRHYMYKYVLSVWHHPKWPDGTDALRISHLDPRDDSYFVMRQGQREETYEIVQGYGEDGQPFYTREKRKPNSVVSHTGALPDSQISNQAPRPGVGL